MPVHTCRYDALESTVAAIEATEERVVAVSAANEDTFIIVTYIPRRTTPKGRETR